MRFAYADPPYIGQARKHYSHDPQCAEVDHAELIAQLETYDGWALSASAPSLHVIVPMLPKDARFGAWVKPFAAFKVGVNPAYAWEPILFKPGRSGKARKLGRKAPTIRDWHSANITLKKGLSGAKPESFCLWLFELLGMEPEDTFDDLFPGTGIVGQVWEKWKASKTP